MKLGGIKPVLLVWMVISSSSKKTLKQEQKFKSPHKELKPQQVEQNLPKRREIPRPCLITTDCVDTAVSYLKLVKDKIYNNEKQLSRMKTQGGAR